MCTIKGTEGLAAVMAVPYRATMPGRCTTLKYQP